jgi:uncharacterized protein
MGHARRSVATGLLIVIWVALAAGGGAGTAASGSPTLPAAPSPRALASAPTASPGAPSISLSPVEDEAYGFRAVVPDGWASQGNGVYARSTGDPSDYTLLLLQSTPLSAAALWPSLESMLVLTAPPAAIGTRDTAALDWVLYHVDVPTSGATVAVDLGLAESTGRTWVALLQTDPAESTPLHDAVFLQVLDAFEPLPAPTPAASPAYDSLEVSFPGGAAGVTLAGTLTVPPGSGPHPAIVLLTGSGPQDRDETIPGMTLKPFAIIADALTRAGVAVLRFDDRGVALSSGDFASATTADFTADGEAAVAYLRSDPVVDAARVGVLGESEGGLEVAAMAVADPTLAFVVAMAGPAVPGVDLLVAQSEAIARASGKPETEVTETGKTLRAVLEAVRDGRIDEAKSVLANALGQAWDDMTSDEQEQAGSRDTYVQANLAQQLPPLETPWVSFLLHSDPGADWRQVRVPVLALFGGKDVQVTADQNAPAMATELATNDRSLATIVVLPDANHLFQRARTGAPPEYVSLEQTFTPDFLPTLVDWVTARLLSRP